MAKKQWVLKSTLMVTLVIILSKAFGFARDMVTNAYFGLSFESDAYNSAYSLFYLPVLLLNSCISATMIPLYVEAREQKSLRRANRFASNAINHFAVVAAGITVLMWIFARPLTHLVYHGFEKEKLDCTVELFRIMLLGLVFNVSSIAVASLLNAAEHYVAAQLSGFPLSACVIAASVFFSHTFGIRALAWGVFAANVLQLLIMVPFLRGWFRYSPILNLRDVRLQRLMVLALPAMLSMGISELNHMIDHALASSLPEGTLTAMTSAYRLVTFLQGVLIVPLTTIMFSRMSRKVAERDEPGAVRMLFSSLTELAVAVIPVVTIGIILSRDVIQFAYMRGRFTMRDTQVTAAILAFYVIGIPAFGTRDFLSRMFHALKDTKTPFRVSIVVVATNIVLNLILRHLMGARGLALATSVAGYVGCAVLIMLLRRRFPDVRFASVLKDLGKIVLSALACAAVCMVLNRVVPQARSTLQVFARLVICAGGALVVYFAGCVTLRVRAFGRLLGGLRH